MTQVQASLSFSTSPGPRVLTHSDTTGCFIIAFLSKCIYFYILLHPWPVISIHTDFPTITWVQYFETPPPLKTIYSNFMIYSIWNGTLAWIVLFFPFWKWLVLLSFFQINYVITEKSLWSSPKNSMLLPDPGTIIMPCIIKPERTSPANCKHPCLHQKAIAKCTLEGSGQSNWVGCLSLTLLSKYCPWVRNWRDKEGGKH